MTAGCSSQFSRFNSTDDVFTGSTANQRQIINGDSQPYPGDNARVAAAPVDGVSTGSVNRGALSPVAAQPLPPPAVPAQPARVAVAQPAPAPAAAPPAEHTLRVPVAEAQKPRPAAPKLASAEPLDRKPTGTVADGSSASTKFDVPANKVPVPSKAPQEKVAVLPQSPKVKEAPAAAGLTASNNAKQPDKQAKTDQAKTEQAKAQPAKAEPVKTAAAKGAYTVESGDTLSKISRKTGVSVTALKAANGMQDGVLKIGQTLKVPAPGETVVAKAAPAQAVDPVSTSAVPAAPKKVAQQETVAAAAPPKNDGKVIEQAEKSEAAAPNSTGIDRMRWPVRGKVISGYSKGGGGEKDGIDIAVPEGTPVKAAENGVVIYAGDGLKEFGNTVLVRHEDGLVTVYGHASQLKVQRGQKVKRGDEIAVSGMSGNANAPKLHFEVRKNSAPVDPTTYLE
ncbi:peptidoglycan DD-metalloendopeptidase family protein [Mesorhizobium yinganensis]|uniref:peptidoglycan DD-metalloendopeptidase family protein n=1 Tax=Mesorhizobium yinganensis TaxID=3157707 RepID=UPI003CCDF5F5